ncbi:MAG TPA: PRC-barrel domain-containing protein [Methylobacterium sp.]|jgi:sporulation protein YlmC with PRC-barrel domain|nr:PRC-barrel domain-containing protein [Methylobacterium sp.]
MADHRYGDSYRSGRDEGARYREQDRDYDRDYRRDSGSDDHGRGGRGDGIFNMGGARERGREEERGGSFGFGGRDDERGGARWNRENDRGFGPDDHRAGLPTDETGHLIASNKVEGTAVYSRDGERLGSIYNFMVDKFSGKVEYAVMAYGGFMGLGERYYPLPWRTLTYDTRAGGYRIDMTRHDLRSAPSFDRDTEPRFDRQYSSRVHDYYGLNY